jgi:hypothetical protein
LAKHAGRSIRSLRYALSLAAMAGGLAASISATLAGQQSGPASNAGAVASKADSTPLAIRDVAVIDVATGQLAAGQTVVIAGNRVQAIGPSAAVPLPSGARIVDARGKFLIPGLWDMHAHVDDEAAEIYPAFIANGVTGIREMAQRGQFPDSFRVWQREVMAGTRAGPRAIGPSADLFQGSGIDLTTPDDAIRVVDSLKAAGDAFIKYHDSFGVREIFFSVAREARRVGIPFVGHVPRSVTDVEAADSGMRSIEHVQENHQCWPGDADAPWDSAATEQRCRPVVAAYLRNGTWFAPTLVVYFYVLRDVGALQDESLLQRMTFRKFADGQRLVRMMHRLGLRNFLTGADCIPAIHRTWGVDPVCHYGFSIREELPLLVGAGLTPLEALQAGTLNPATFLDATDSLGAVAPGKLADLVLLDADPLTDIRNVMKIRAVVANGRYFDRAALDAMDPETVERTRRYAEQQGAPWADSTAAKGQGP